MENEIYCKILENMVLEKTGKKATVLYGECGNLGNWFYIERTLYDERYRLGMFESSSISFLKSLESLPSDVVLSG